MKPQVWRRIIAIHRNQLLLLLSLTFHNAYIDLLVSDGFYLVVVVSLFDLFEIAAELNRRKSTGRCKPHFTVHPVAEEFILQEELHFQIGANH